ncbi:uncharacterized protein METZ01_LOCUS35464, partial [marine metagenome]
VELSIRLFAILATGPPNVVVPYDKLSKLQSFAGANVILRFVKPSNEAIPTLTN